MGFGTDDTKNGPVARGGRLLWTAGQYSEPRPGWVPPSAGVFRFQNMRLRSRSEAGGEGGTYGPRPELTSSVVSIFNVNRTLHTDSPKHVRRCAWDAAPTYEAEPLPSDTASVPCPLRAYPIEFSPSRLSSLPPVVHSGRIGTNVTRRSGVQRPKKAVPVSDEHMITIKDAQSTDSALISTRLRIACGVRSDGKSHHSRRRYPSHCGASSGVAPTASGRCSPRAGGGRGRGHPRRVQHRPRPQFNWVSHEAFVPPVPVFRTLQVGP